MSFSGLSSAEQVSVADFLKQPAEKYDNDQSVELQWAMKAFHHAEVYFSLLTAADPSLLKLSRVDDKIYEDFRKKFPDLAVDVLDEDHIKSADEKVKWREFCGEYKGKVADYNMGTLIRVRADEDVSEANTTLVPRIQFLAIEISRNREGYNDGLREKYKPKDKEES